MEDKKEDKKAKKTGRCRGCGGKHSKLENQEHCDRYNSTHSPEMIKRFGHPFPTNSSIPTLSEFAEWTMQFGGSFRKKRGG